MIWATRPYSVMWGQGYCEYLTRYGAKFLSIVRVGENKADYFTDKDSFEAACRRFGNEIVGKSEDFLEGYESAKKKVLDISAELSEKAGKIRDDKLAALYSKYWVLAREFDLYMMLIHSTERFLEPQVKGMFPKEFDVITGLSRPLEHLNMDKASLTETPKNMAKKFGYLSTYAFLGKQYDERFFRSYRAERKELAKKLADIKENRKRFGRFIKTLKGEDRKICELLNGLVFIRTDRIDAWKKHSVMLYPFVDYLARKISPKIGREEIVMMSREEISELLISGKHPPVEALITRAKSENFIVTFTKEGISMVDDAKLRKGILDRYHASVEIKDEVKGMPACKGIVKGIVRIYRSPKDIKEGESGFVMVSKHTSPQDLPYMKRAIAIITNEGGVTSHAAIVSRELGIPCVVGAKIATSVFKEGDLVEVDANKGIIRKLKNK